jgi:preprotein translocase subunit SecY
MKKAQQNPADLAKAASKLAELKSRILFLVGALIVFRVGTYIPVPGVDPAELKNFFDQQSGNLLGLFNMFSGGARMLPMPPAPPVSVREPALRGRQSASRMHP